MIVDRPKQPDPLSQIIALLRPRATVSKLVLAGGAWSVRRTDRGRPYYCAMLEGTCRLLVDGRSPMRIDAGDFVLVPAADGFTKTGSQPMEADVFSRPMPVGPGTVRLGDPATPADVRMLVGHGVFRSDNARLLAPLLPAVIHVSGRGRLAKLADLINDEAHADRPGREPIITRLIEVLLIEALRASDGPLAAPGVLRGLRDPRLAVALRCMHAAPQRAWTVALLARGAGLSRSTFFDRFRQEVGVAPMEYLLGWRMALAKDMLGEGAASPADAAMRVGYASASTFSTAFRRHTGVPPGRYARDRLTSPADGRVEGR